VRLERLSPALVRRAIQIYLDLAWPAGERGTPPITLASLEPAATLAQLLDQFEKPSAAEGPRCARYVLRLGNYRYPFMKFVVQEYLVQEEYFFSVDTHDDLRVTPEMPDYEGWQEVKRLNRELKQRIESAWTEAGLPTNASLRVLMEGLAQLEKEDDKRARLLVVDDERSVARGLEAALLARGYAVEVAFDGRQVLDRLERDPVPDLVLLDYAMPEFDGEEVIRRLRADDRCRDVPVLLATASSIDLASMPRSCGLLRKPYPREVLFAMIGQLLGESAKGSSTGT